ncbi:hypothetical protein CEW46_26940 [Bacillus cereus]|nr:hypothetical protein CEW46_26940 [Bacillus cereus]
MEHKKLAIDLTDSDAIKKLIATTESSLYGTVNDKGERVLVGLDKGKGMELTIYQSNGWTRIEHYDKDGYRDHEAPGTRYNLEK